MVDSMLDLAKMLAANKTNEIADYIVSLLEKIEQLESENEDLQDNFDDTTSIICRLEAENKALKEELFKAFYHDACRSGAYPGQAKHHAKLRLDNL